MKEKEKAIKGDLTGRSRDEDEERDLGIKYIKMYPYHQRNTKYEEHTTVSKSKMVSRMEYDFKNEG